MAAGDASVVDKQRLLQRVLESRIFSKAPKRREFLRYICEQEIAGRTDPVHEREIGIAVYQRSAGYDPSEDNIVRVEARNLRKQLEQFFETEGADEPLVLRIPKGKYVPVFDQQRAVPPPAGATISFRRSSLVLAAAALVCLTFLFSRFVGGLPPETGAAASIPPHPLWSSLFDQSRETYLVVADSNFASLQTYLGRTLRLADYLKPGFGLSSDTAVPEDVSRIVERFSSTPATSYADVALAVKIMRLPWAMRSSTTIRFARDINVRDFKNKNAILLGSVCSNPWAELWEPRLNFSIVHDHHANEAWIENGSPHPGEQERYPETDSGPSYALVSLAPNLNGTGTVLLLAGIGMEGTEAAGDLVTSDLAFRKVAEELGFVSGGKLKNFEAVLEFSSVQGAPAKEPHVVAHRMLHPGTSDAVQTTSDSVWPAPSASGAH